MILLFLGSPTKHVIIQVVTGLLGGGASQGILLSSMVVSGSPKRWEVAYNLPEGNI